MDVKLRPMRNDEFADWLPQMRDDYARSMIEEGGVSPESASQRAAAQTEQLFPGERPSADARSAFFSDWSWACVLNWSRAARSDSL